MKKTAKKTIRKKVTMTEAKAAFATCVKARKVHTQTIKAFHDLWNRAIADCQNEESSKSPVVKFFDEHEYDVI